MFQPITTEKAKQFCENMEENRKMGAKFFRNVFGIESRNDAVSLDAEEIGFFFKIGIESLSKELCRRKSIASEDVIRDIRNHVIRAYPQLKRVGFTIKAGSSPAPTKAFLGFPSAMGTYEFQQGVVYSFCWSWELRDQKDILDETEVLEDMVREQAQGPIEHPRELNPVPRDPGFTSAGVRTIANSALLQGIRDGERNAQSMTQFVLDWIDQRAKERVAGMKFPAPRTREIKNIPCQHKGMDVEAIDAKIASYFPAPVPAPAPAPSRSRSRAKA